MQKSTLSLSILLLSSLLFFSCKKGDTGPAGPAGPRGVAGSPNVKYSSWQTLNMTFSTTDSIYEETIKIDSLTKPILDSGVILTYLKYTDPNTGVTQIVN